MTLAIPKALTDLHDHGYEVKTEKWQGVDSPAAMWELLHYTLRGRIPNSPTALNTSVKPNQPWAEDHFKERVAGKPVNPGEQYKNWPFYPRNVEKHQSEEDQKFTHTYMERMWCEQFPLGLSGIHYRYGDLYDLLDLLAREPDTRQAFLPIWFPEDTGVVHRGRVPCTIGYHFMLRNGELHCMYYIRSCDALRHLRDDIYLACRKVQWIIEQLKGAHSEGWEKVTPGDLTMCIGSLHCWLPERGLLVKGLQR